MLWTGLMHTLYLIWRNFTFQVPSFDVAFLAEGCRPCCVQHSSGSRELSIYDRQCNVAWTAMNTSGDNLHSCRWHDDVCVSCHWLASWTLATQLSPQNLYTAVVSMTWSLQLGSPQNGQAVLYLFWRHSQFQSLWLLLKQKKFGGTCAVNPLSPACHVNPTLITNIYSKICDI
jgi:hypothetical protein